MLKILLAILMTVAPVLGYAQSTGKIIDANGFNGTLSKKNYVKNPNAEHNTDGVTATGTGATVLASASNPFFDNKSFRFGGTLGNTIVGTFAFNDFSNGMVDGSTNCYTSYWMSIDSNGIMTVNMKLAGTTVATQTIDASLSAIPKRQYFLYYPCGTFGQDPILEMSFANTIGTDTNLWNVDEIHGGYWDGISVPDGANFVGSIKWANTLNCNWARNSAAWGNYAVDADCPVPTTKGALVYQGTKIPAFNLPAGSPAGRYVITGRGAFYKNSAAGDLAGFRFSDGTNTSSQQAVFNSTASVQVPVISGEITYTSALAATTTIQVQCIGTATTGCQIDVSSTGIPDLEFEVIRYPLNNTSYTGIVPAFCINNPDCQNTFSAKVSATGVVTDENYSFINGNCVVTSTSLYTCTLDTSRFSVAPTCTATTTTSGSNLIVRLQGQATTTTAAFFVINTSAAATAGDFNITCTRAGTDVKPWGPIPLLSGMVSSNSTGSERIERAKVVCSNTTPSITSQSDSWLTSIAVGGSTGVCTLVWPSTTWSSAPTCSLGLEWGSTANDGQVVWNSNPTTTGGSLNVSTGTAGIDGKTVSIICMGPR